MDEEPFFRTKSANVFKGTFKIQEVAVKFITRPLDKISSDIRFRYDYKNLVNMIGYFKDNEDKKTRQCSY